MARLSRRELKKDEFADHLSMVTHAFSQNRRRIVLGGGAALVVVGVSLAVLLFLRSRQAGASEAFGKGLVTYHTVVAEALPPGATIAHFKTAEEKYKKALEEFTRVAAQYRGYRQGQWARYYAALCQRELGQSAEAEKELTALAGESNQDLAAVAKMALAGLYRQTSRTEEAEKLYRELESRPTSLVPKPTVQIALAEMYQKTNPSRATALYQQIEKDYPGTAAGDEATRKLRGPTP